MIEDDEEVTHAYRFARYAVQPEQVTNPKSKSTRTEWQYTRESVQWACWLHALESSEDRLSALELVALVGKYSQVGQDWEVLRTAARRNIAGGYGTKEDEDLLALDEPQ